MLYQLLSGALAAYSIVVFGLFLLQRRLLYRPSRLRPQLADLAPLGVREIELTTEDGLRLLSWYLPPRAGRAVIAYFHGNGGHVGHRADRLRHFARAGFGVLMAEYRGYGGNPGLPCERGLFADGAAALDFLAHTGIAPTDIVLWGESLGSGIAVYLAGWWNIAALVLEAPFISIAAAAQRHYPYVPTSMLVRDRFDSLSRIDRVTAPLLILHGERDAIVPISHGQALLNAAKAPKQGWFVPQAGHENLAEFGALEEAILFIKRHTGASVPDANRVTRPPISSGGEARCTSRSAR
jgi:uncharacterized protein